jgi:hypothetical protein
MDLSPHQLHGSYHAAAPPMGNTLSDLQQKVMSDIASRQQAATRNPQLNGEAARGRLRDSDG